MYFLIFIISEGFENHAIFVLDFAIFFVNSLAGQIRNVDEHDKVWSEVVYEYLEHFQIFSCPLEGWTLFSTDLHVE
jgi:hypothetical protein